MSSIGTYTASATVADYTSDASGAATQKLEVYTPGSETTYPVLVYVPDTGATYDGTLLSARDGLAFMARAAGMAVVKVSFRQAGAAAVFQEPEDDVAQAVQYLRENAAELFLDPERLVAYGVRRGANAAAWCALGPDLADGGGNSQEQQSTRLAGALLDRCVAYWQAMVQASTPATDFTATANAKLSAIATGTQDAASPALYGDIAANADLPVFLVSNAAAVSSDTTPAYPTGVETALGSAWHATALLEVLAGQGAQFHADWSQAWNTSEAESPADLVLEKALDWALWVVGMLPVEELAIRAIEAKLRTMTHAHGYATDVQRVERWEEFREDVPVWPAIMVSSLDGDYDEDSFATKEQGINRIGLALLNRGWQRSTTRASQFIADLRKCLNDDAYWTARSTVSRIGIGQPFLVHVTHARRFADLYGNEEQRSGASAIAVFRFRDARGDPYTELP